jgi:hypothetical protein
MPGRYETTTAGPSQGLNEGAQNSTPDPVESVCSTGQTIALVALLVFACLLVLTPAVVAGVSMVSPSALEQAYTPFMWVSPITSHLDLAKLVVGAGSVVMVMNSWEPVDEAA